MSNRKKPRSLSVPMDHGRPTRIDKVGFINGEIVMISDGVKVNPVGANIVTSYERTNRPKILSNVALLGQVDPLTWSPEYALREYDFVYAIDTNMRSMRSEQVSATAIVQCRFIPISPDKTVALRGHVEEILGCRNIQQLADAELHFVDGPLNGLKLIDFGIWERRHGWRSQCHLSGAPVQRQQRTPLLRAAAPANGDIASQEAVRELILAAYAEHTAPV